ncbi:hypothetical protein [Lacinutrix salivirga]
MNKDILDIIEEELFKDNIDTELKDDCIFWKDNFGTENEIHINQIAVNGHLIAWWQKNEVGKELVRIKVKDGIIINWRPPINTMELGSLGCDYIKFYFQFLIVKYKDKHRHRIFIIDTKHIQVEEIETSGYTQNVKLNGDKLLIRDMGYDIIITTVQAKI